MRIKLFHEFETIEIGIIEMQDTKTFKRKK